MIINVWLMAKKGEDRVYTRTTTPSDSQMAAYREAGFKVFRAEVHMPVDWDDVDEVLDVYQLEEVESPDAEQAG